MRLRPDLIPSVAPCRSAVLAQRMSVSEISSTSFLAMSSFCACQTTTFSRSGTRRAFLICSSLSSMLTYRTRSRKLSAPTKCVYGSRALSSFGRLVRTLDSAMLESLEIVRSVGSDLLYRYCSSLRTKLTPPVLPCKRRCSRRY